MQGYNTYGGVEFDVDMTSNSERPMGGMVDEDIGVQQEVTWRRILIRGRVERAVLNAPFPTSRT